MAGIDKRYISTTNLQPWHFIKLHISYVPSVRMSYQSHVVGAVVEEEATV